MDTELAQIRDFLTQHAPFDALPQAALQALPRQLTVRYYRRGSRVLERGLKNDHMFVVRSGAVEVTGDGGALVKRCEAGECFGMSSLLLGQVAQRDAVALEDTLVYLLPAKTFHALRAQHPEFERFADRVHSERLSVAIRELHQADTQSSFLKTQLSTLLTRSPITTPSAASIRSAAQKMRDERVSSLLVLDEGRLVGIVTDRDLRNRVVAEGRSSDAPVRSIMTPNPHTVQAESYAFEALLALTRHGVHHLPVMRGGDVTGLVSATDLLRLQTANPLYLVSDIGKHESASELARAARQLPTIVTQLIREDATADNIGRVVTAVGDALARQLLQLAETQLGAPPVPYCWLALGSQARLEQGLGSDQDHALLLSDEAQPEHGAYFSDLAAFVSDGLNACGYPHCPGDVMATNPRWQLTLSGWGRQFESWVQRPEPEALLNSTIFFDMRALHGDASLLETLLGRVLALTKSSSAFLAHLSKTALEHRPPLGFFRGFVVETSGDHAEQFDLKHRGVAPIVNLARVYALGAGVAQTNTQARLRAAAHQGLLSAEGATNLSDALEFIAYVRLRQQARQLEAGEAPSNFVSPKSLTPFEKRHLRDAFGIVKTMQAALEQRYALRLLG